MIGFGGFSQLKTYEILMLFAVYGILGWAVEQLLVVLRGVKGRRGVLGIPCGIMYGIGGVLIAGLSLSEGDPWWGALITCVGGAVALNAAACGIVKLLSGGRLWRFSFVYSVIGGLIAFVVARLVHPLIIVMMNSLPLWFEWAFLVAFYIFFVSQCVEAPSRLLRKRAGRLNYPRWDLAYPVSAAGSAVEAAVSAPDSAPEKEEAPDGAPEAETPDNAPESAPETDAAESTPGMETSGRDSESEAPAGVKEQAEAPAEDEPASDENQASISSPEEAAEAADAAVPAKKEDVVFIDIPEGESGRITFPPNVFANGAVMFGSAAGDAPAAEAVPAKPAEEKIDLVKELQNLQKVYGFDEDEEVAGPEADIPAAAADLAETPGAETQVQSDLDEQDVQGHAEAGQTPSEHSYKHDKKGPREPKTVVTDPLEHFRRIARQRNMAPEQADDYISIIKKYEVPSFLKDDTSTYDFKGPSVFSEYWNTEPEDKDAILSVEISPPDGLS